MAAEPLVSVVVPVHDGERYLHEALDSVGAQTYRRTELIVVDDGSTDASGEVARRFGARVDRRPHGGAAAARNRGLELARGDCVAFLDADDVWAHDKLERQLAALSRDSGVDLVFGHLRQFVSPDLATEVAARLRWEPGALPGRLPSALLARRTAFERVGPFAVDWRVGELMEWLLRAREQGLREAMVPEVVVHRRLHPVSSSLRHRGSITDHAHILKRAIDRRRARAGG
jgi:glycosyltransferase involved in cell wall biosynthesis